MTFQFACRKLQRSKDLEPASPDSWIQYPLSSIQYRESRIQNPVSSIQNRESSYLRAYYLRAYKASLQL